MFKLFLTVILACCLQMVGSQTAIALSCPVRVVSGLNLLKCTIDTTVMTAEGCGNIGANVEFGLTLPGLAQSTVCTTSRTTCDNNFSPDGCRCVNSTDFEYNFQANSSQHKGGDLSCFVDCFPTQDFTTDYADSCQNIFPDVDPCAICNCTNCTCTICDCALSPGAVTGIVIGIEIVIGGIAIAVIIYRCMTSDNLPHPVDIAVFVIANVFIIIDVVVGPVVYIQQGCCNVTCCQDDCCRNCCPNTCCQDDSCQTDCCKFSDGLIAAIATITVVVLAAQTASFLICILKVHKRVNSPSCGPVGNNPHEPPPSDPVPLAEAALVTSSAPKPDKKKLENDNSRINGQDTGTKHNGADNNSTKKKRRKQPKEETEMTGLKESSSPSDEESGMRPLPQPATGENATPRLPPITTSGGLTSVERNSFAESQSRKLPLPDISPSNNE